MKVCHFAATKGIGRGEAFVEISNEMSNKIETFLLCPRGSLFKDNILPTVNYHEYKTIGSRNNPFLLYELYRYFKKNNFDLVHSHFGKATRIFAKLNRFLNLPHIATKHNPRTSNAFGNVKYITVVSNEAYSTVNKSKSQVKVIKNGIRASLDEEISTRIPHSPFRILAIGRLDSIKGFDILIKQLSNIKFDYVLNIAGEGRERKLLESTALKNLSPERYNFLGFRHDIKELMNNSDIVVSSSHSEGCPIVFIEALFYARVFISTRVGEAGELLPEAFLTDHKNLSSKITEVYNSYKNMQRDFRLIADKVKMNYSSNATISEYLKAYEIVIKNGKF